MMIRQVHLPVWKTLTTRALHSRSTGRLVSLPVSHVKVKFYSASDWLSGWLTDQLMDRWKMLTNSSGVQTSGPFSMCVCVFVCCIPHWPAPTREHLSTSTIVGSIYIIAIECMHVNLCYGCLRAAAAATTTTKTTMMISIPNYTCSFDARQFIRDYKNLLQLCKRALLRLCVSAAAADAAAAIAGSLERIGRAEKATIVGKSSTLSSSCGGGVGNRAGKELKSVQERQTWAGEQKRVHRFARPENVVSFSQAMLPLTG